MTRVRATKKATKSFAVSLGTIAASIAIGLVMTPTPSSGRVDRVAPPAPVLTEYPANPSTEAETTFAWTDAEAGVGFECSLENGPWRSCASPYRYVVQTNANGTHQFAVRAVDAAGNRSTTSSYAWKVSDVGFTITGTLIGQLYPGTWRELGLTIVNPNNYTIYVTSLTVRVSSSPSACPDSTNVEFIQSPLSSSHRFGVAAKSSAPLPAADRPLMRLRDLPVNQDACKDQTFSLTYSGTGTK